MVRTTEPSGLSKRLAGGDVAEYEARLVASYPRIIRFVHRLLGWRDDDVAEIAQEVYTTAWQKRFSFRGEAALETWLMGIAINKCRRWRLLASLRRRRLTAIARENVPNAESPADAAAIERERSELVRAAVRTLAHKDRQLIVLRYLEQLSTSEIAALLDVTPGVLDVRLHRARRKLEALLRPLLPEESS